RVNDVLEKDPEFKPPTTLEKPKLYLNQVKGDVEFENISFRYGDEDSPLILNNLNLSVKAGMQIALVGKSGCGKSTLVKLLAGFIMPSEGTILIDGREISNIDIYSLRQQIGWVLQSPFIFNGTVIENIALGMTNPKMDDVIRAADLAAAHEFIVKLPAGYKTRIGESGLQLSGGQKQRVCIARALYNNPKILIFDEATSALDVASEKRIQENLNKILVGRTAFIIAHRLSTVRQCNLICYMGDGVILEQGTHDELVKKKGLYYGMVTEQVGHD
ncbi:MAG: ATP-binding cassette domain-containing protein, partial [Candidatus Cloacimonetes bacterium]|nr:ATP-binding cassette domain-containing protein [Candidatus Cloacimonadota bacterium]